MAVKEARAWPEGDAGYVPLAAKVLHGQTLGLIGFGGVGRRLAWFGRALGMQVLAIRASGRPPRPSFRPPELEFAGEATAGVTVRGPDGLDELLDASDYLVIAVPRTPSTIGMIGRDELARMKATSHLVNTARGGIVDEAALADALRRGRPAFASIDVTAVEPLAGDSPLYDLPNCQITPHIAGYFIGYEDAAAQLFAANLARYVSGHPLLNQVDRAAGY
jgi:phosphoglycerate dehydrogenase-like enzyme